MEKVQIPKDFNYDAIKGFSTESRQKFNIIKPFSLGQASRIAGVRASDIAILVAMLKTKTK
jgi:tRNA uridine 5-carboxymethylaminomethyl modification enzyme